MKRIHIYHQYFRTPAEGGAIRSYYLAKGLLDAGHEVNIITAHNHLTGKHIIEGIAVYYLPIKYQHEFGSLRRIVAFLKYALLASCTGLKLPKPQVNYVISTPLTIGMVAFFLRFFRKTPFIVEIGDLWPAAPIQLGYIKSSLLKKTLYWFEKIIYQKANSIVAMSPDIEKYLSNHVSTDKVSMIPNMSDCEFYYPQQKASLTLKKYHVENKFVISYIGTAGNANHLEYLVEAAQASQYSLPNVQYIVAASGRELSKIQLMAKDLTNIFWIKYLDRNGVKELLSITDAVYISFANVPILSSGSPNKFFDGLAAGKLIITNFTGWTREVIQQNNCGYSYDTDNIQEYIDKLKIYSTEANTLQIAKDNARQLALKDYSRTLLIKKWLELFD